MQNRKNAMAAGKINSKNSKINKRKSVKANVQMRNTFLNNKIKPRGRTLKGIGQASLLRKGEQHKQRRKTKALQRQNISVLQRLKPSALQKLKHESL